jgi:hypothetical protein
MLSLPLQTFRRVYLPTIAAHLNYTIDEARVIIRDLGFPAEEADHLLVRVVFRR